MPADDDDDGYDLDEVFCYDTNKEVRVLDRRLGLIYYCTLGMVLAYVVIYCQIVMEQYLEEEKSNGFMLSKVINPSFANITEGTGIPFDVFESITNPGESGALFIPTRVIATRGQKQSGFCPNKAYKCESAADCTDEFMSTPPECNGGRCVRRGWCPPEELGGPNTEMFKIDAESYKVWFQGKVMFHQLDATVGNTEQTEPRVQGRNKNTYWMHDILRMGRASIEQVWKEGAVLSVQNIFKCNLMMDEADACTTKLEVGLIDKQTGYNYKNNVYRKEKGEVVRDSYHLYGIRLVIFSTGVGSRPSFSQIVLQCSQAIALLGCAATCADMFLQYVVPERKHYIEEKIKTTEDFGD